MTGLIVDDTAILDDRGDAFGLDDDFEAPDGTRYVSDIHNPGGQPLKMPQVSRAQRDAIPHVVPPPSAVRPPPQTENAPLEGETEAERCLQNANSAQQSGNLDAAYRFYTTGLKSARSTGLRATLLGNRSVLWAQMGYWEKALEDAEEGVRLRPDLSRSHECNGAALEGVGRIEEALASFSKALLLDPNNRALQEIVSDLRETIAAAPTKAPEVVRPQQRAVGVEMLRGSANVMSLLGTDESTAQVLRAAAPPPPPPGHKQAASSCRILLTIIAAKHLPSMDFFGSCDGLVEVEWDGQRFTTSAKKNTYDPEWNEAFTFTFPSEPVGDINLAVKDWDQAAVLSYDHVGDAVVKDDRVRSFLQTAKSPAQAIQVFHDLEVKDKKGRPVMGADKQPCVISVKLQRTDLPEPEPDLLKTQSPSKGIEKMEGKSPVPPGHSYANPTRRIIVEEKQKVQFEPADLTKMNFTSDLSMSVRVKSPPGSRPAPVQPSSDRAHVLRGIRDIDGNPLQTYDDQRFQTWEDIKQEGRGSTPVLYLGISCIRDEAAAVRVPQQPPPPPHPKSPVVIKLAPPPPSPPPKSPVVIKVAPPPPPEVIRIQQYYPLGTLEVAPSPQQPARAAQKVVDAFPLVPGDDESAFVQWDVVQIDTPQPSAAMGDATVMHDHLVLYETTVYEQVAAHSPRPSVSTRSYPEYVPLSSQHASMVGDGPQRWRTSANHPGQDQYMEFHNGKTVWT